MLSDEKILKIAKWLEQFDSYELDTISKLVWKAKQKAFSNWDKKIAGQPYKKKKP